MGGLIDMDFKTARQQADRLDRLANELESLTVNDYEAAMGQIRSGWSGEAAGGFLAKGGALEGDMKSTVKKIRELANSIRSTAHKAEDAQKKAQEIINKKNF